MMKCLISLCVPALIASAATASVQITCVIDSVPMVARYRADGDPSASVVAGEIALAVGNRLPNFIPQWRYSRAVGDATLELHVRSNSAGQHSFVLLLLVGHTRNTVSSAVWLQPGELDAIGGYPPRRDLAQAIAIAVEEKLVEPYQKAILETMKQRVPVVSGGQWLRTVGPREEPRLVVPLPYGDARILTNSTFRVECSWPQRSGTATLESRAMPLPATYKDAQTREGYDALTLKPFRRVYEQKEMSVREVAQEVWQLVPLKIYLLEFQDPLEVAVAAGEGGR
jgi:hypothetical protein